jgi:hypothetical protein
MAKGVKKSSITSNVDSSLTPQQRALKEIDDRNDGRIQDAIDKQKGQLPAPKLIAPHQQYTTTYDRLAEQSAYASGDKKSIIPLAVQVGAQYPGGFHWILSDADYELVQAGYACGYCLCTYDGVWRPACPVCGADRDVLN